MSLSIEDTKRLMLAVHNLDRKKKYQVWRERTDKLLAIMRRHPIDSTCHKLAARMLWRFRYGWPY